MEFVGKWKQWNIFRLGPRNYKGFKGKLEVLGQSQGQVVRKIVQKYGE